MNINDVITLDNNAKYLILDSIDYQNNTYLFTVGLFDDGEFDYTDFLFFKKSQDEQGFLVEAIMDKKLITELLLIVIAGLDESDDMINYLQEEIELLKD